MATADTGVRVNCPGCGQTMMQKAMIPVLAATGGGGGMAYLCIPCARQAVVVRPEPPPRER